MENIISEISSAAKRHKQINKVVLFGSRARGDNNPKSDIDLAVYSNDDIFNFIEDIEENVSTLLEFDITDMRDEFENDFINQIESDGIIIYEQS